MLPLHTPESVFSPRHVPSWLLLAASGGAVNAIGFVAHARFISHVTGTISRIGIDASGGGWLAFESVVVVGCLVLGAMSAGALVGDGSRGRAPRHALPLMVVAATLTVLGALGTAGVFGDFGGSTNEIGNFVFLSVLAFTMGLQNAAVGTSTGLIVRTTHMTGAATDLGVHLGAAFTSEGDARRVSVRHAALRAGKLAAFTFGALAGAVVAGRFGFLSLLSPAFAVLIAAVLSYVRFAPPLRSTRSTS